MPFTSQTIHYADGTSIAAMIHRLEEKLSVGELLEMKAKAQNITKNDSANEADESYTYEWALFEMKIDN